MGIETAALGPPLVTAGGHVISAAAGAKGGQQLEGFGSAKVQGAMDEAQRAVRSGAAMADDRMYDPIPYPQWDVSSMLGTTQIPGLDIDLGMNPGIQGILDQNPFAQYTPQRPEEPQAVPRGPVRREAAPKGGEGQVTPDGFLQGQQGAEGEQMLTTPDESRRALTDVSMVIQELMKMQSGGGIPSPDRQNLKRSV